MSRRALLRAMCSGIPSLADRVTEVREGMLALVVRAMGSPDDTLVAEMLQDLWFGKTIGWAAGMYDDAHVKREVRRAVVYLLATS